MVNISIDVTDLGGEARPGDKVVFWRPRMGGSATHAGRVISTAPVTVFLADGKATVSDVEPGEMTVLLQCRGVESQGPVTVGVPDGTGTVTLRSLIESQFEYAPPIVSAVQEAADNAAASERAAIQAQVRSEAAADRADAKVDDAINNGANLIRNEVKQDADRAVSARQAATQSESNAAASEDAAAQSESNAATSETNAKQSETNAGDFAAVATTAATEAVDAMERATDLAGGDFATHEYVDQKILTGEGRPGSVVAAPQGVIYTDFAATNGAVQWFKASGDGTTGWKLLQGYTGIREVSNLVTGLDTTQRNHHGAWIVREGNTVTLWGNGYSVGALHLTSILPDGFRPPMGHYIANVGSGVAGREIYVVGHHNAWTRLTFSGGNPPEGLNLSIQARWITPDDWPSILPGTPE